MLEGCVCVCSRGLIFSQMPPSIWGNLKGRREDWEWIPSHILAIPDAQNWVTHEALALGPEFLWYVEEDIEVPPGTLPAMIARMKETRAQAVAVAVDYHLKQNGQLCHRYAVDGSLLFGGMGCLLVRAAIFEQLPRPFFQAARYMVLDDGSAGRQGLLARYGGQDIHFYVQLRHAGFLAVALPGVLCGHARLIKPGALGTNDGVHEIEII